MRLEYLGDALDHFKGSLFRRLQGAGLLKNLAVDPMATDIDAWAEDHFRLYADLLAVDSSRVLGDRGTLDASGRRDLGKIQGHGGDLFLDPDTGVRTGTQSPIRQYVRPDEILRLLGSSPRVVAVYQHAWRNKNRSKSAESAIQVVSALNKETSALAYVSAQVSMIFFSRDQERIRRIADFLGDWVGEKAEKIVFGVLPRKDGEDDD